MASEELPKYEDVVEMIEQSTGTDPDDQKVLKAVDSIETMFTMLTKELSSVDARSPPPKSGPFTPKLRTLHQTFRDNVQHSKKLAVEIATYGNQFGFIIVPLSQNKEYTIDQRKAKLEEFINQATIFEKGAKATTEQFNTLKSDFSEFVGIFSGWAKENLDEDTTALKKLTRLGDKIFTYGVIAGLSFIGTGTIAVLFPFPASLLLALVPGASFIYFSVVLINALKKLVNQQAIFDGLTKSIVEIRNPQTHLEALGENNLKTMDNNISVLSAFWSAVHSDALKVKTWLERGAKDADMPEYMKISLDKSDKLYEEMASRLYQYAEELSLAGIPLPKPTT